MNAQLCRPSDFLHTSHRTHLGTGNAWGFPVNPVWLQPSPGEGRKPATNSLEDCRRQGYLRHSLDNTWGLDLRLNGWIWSRGPRWGCSGQFRPIEASCVLGALICNSSCGTGNNVPGQAQTPLLRWQHGRNPYRLVLNDGRLHHQLTEVSSDCRHHNKMYMKQPCRYHTLLHLQCMNVS